MHSTTDAYRKGSIPSVSESLFSFTRGTLPRLMGATLVISLLPLPEDYVLGNAGEIFFAPLAPLLLLLATGFVAVNWYVLCALMWPIRKARRVLPR